MISLQEFEALTCYQSPRLWGPSSLIWRAFGIYDMPNSTRYLVCLCAQVPRLQSLPGSPRAVPVLAVFVGAKVLKDQREDFMWRKLDSSHEEVPFLYRIRRMCMAIRGHVRTGIPSPNDSINLSEITSECAITCGCVCFCVYRYTCTKACVDMRMCGSQMLTCGTIP